MHTDFKNFMCTYCTCNVPFSQCGQVSQHLKSQKHVSNEKLFEEKKQRQTFISVKNDSTEKLCEVLAKAGLPFNFLANMELKGFLEAELGYKLPSETSVRKDYLVTVVQTKFKTLITELLGKNLCHF